MKKKKLIVFLGTLFLVMMVLLLIWSIYFKEKTVAVVKVIEVSNDFMVIKDQLNVKTTINVPRVITKLINVNEEYFVEYESSFIGSPKLVSIEPLN
ncbi:hypothetical protein T458_07275 [Brevibacillus panacihumi W25]|uniref:Uncharacterized protein n=2 Tax=Brevibacillus panacihumi TaxID=497735 RepID=V6MBU9_9BACL|nr:hypothetical protein [Brevibacillus panacihumi]EST55707.1 hypothetical protein T458_07275 [Brevibacillus panacihumi W25]RNB74739.1 hypothetical protein EDM58_19705 [Brevibacillus panacihumi]